MRAGWLIAVVLLAPAAGAAEEIETAKPADAEANKRVSMLALDLDASNLNPEDVQLVDTLVVQALSRHARLNVLSSSDIRQMIDLETERQAVGCDTNSCLAEIAGAMGAQYVVYGTAGQLGETILVQLNLFDSSTGTSINREKIETTDLGALPRLVEPAIDRLVAELAGIEPPPREPVATAPAASAGPHPGWYVTGAGAVVAVVGVTLAVVGVLPVFSYNAALAEHQQIPELPDNVDDANSKWEEVHGHAEAWNTWGMLTTAGGVGLAVVGLGVAGGGAAWAALAGGE
jgi:TolB-like protein